ncbi:DCL family protein [Tardiphaga sp. 813_E8_N1_3]|uniref:DCL family protein n=1 Tax=Tardiphaga sp. 813_E8_N1_3 TaxID=3240760 RepID=UPI003F220350
MAKKAIEIGGLLFGKKGDAVDHYRAILYRHAVGVPIPEPDATQLHWLIERHPESSSKIGVGVAHFAVRDAVYGTRCFEIVRLNGQNTDFSLKSCIDGEPSSRLSETLKAMRAEVAEDIRQKKWEIFRTSTLPDGKVPCAVSGRHISLEEAFADHTPPHSFKSIALCFIESSQMELSEELITASQDNQYQPAFRDRALAGRWRNFYNQTAIIRVVSREK